MYNRYIPNGTAYTRVPEEDAPPFARPGGPGRAVHQPPNRADEEPHRAREQGHGPGQNHSGTPRQDQADENRGPRHSQEPPRPHVPPPPPQEEGGKREGFLSGLLKSFKLDDLDTGDILLLLILVFLILDGDGDNLELIITLGLVILFSLGDKKKEQESD